VSSKQARYPHTHRSRDIWDRWGKVHLQACDNKTGNAANVPLLHELQHGAPRREQVRRLSTDTGDKMTVKGQVLLIAQGARGTLNAQALRPRDVGVT